MSWIKGTVEAVKQWVKEETEGMVESSSEAPGDEFKEGHKHVSLTPELDKMKEEVKDKSYFDTNTRKWVHNKPVKDVKSFYNCKTQEWEYTGSYEVEAHNERVLRDRPVAPTGVDRDPLQPPLAMRGEPGLNFNREEGRWVSAIHPPLPRQDYKEGKDWTNWKPTNPKDLMGIRKVSFCCVPWPVVGEGALGMQEGGMKYGRHNYRDEGVAASTYVDAAMRHLLQFWEGEDIDEESGIHHIGKAISTLFVLRDAQLNDKCTDDRPIRPKNVSWLKDLNEKASKLVDKYPQPERPYCHISMRDDPFFKINETNGTREGDKK